MVIAYCVFKLVVFVALFAPPSVHAEQYRAEPATVLERLEQAGVKLQGRDPFDGTGLCGPLLPVNGPEDVYYVTLPCRFDERDLRLLCELPNIQQVRCERVISAVEAELIRNYTCPSASILCHVLCHDGMVRFGPDM